MYSGFVKFPKSSRGWQSLQHIVSGTMQIFNYSVAGLAAGFALGKIDWWLFAGVGIVTFILNRLSSEISFQTSKSLFKEYKR